MCAESGGFLSDPQPGEIWCQRIKIVRELPDEKVIIEISDEFGVLKPYKDPVKKKLITVFEKDPYDPQTFIKKVKIEDINPTTVVIVTLNKEGAPASTERSISKKQFIKDYHLPY